MRSNLLALFAGCVVAFFVSAQSFTPTDVAWMGQLGAAAEAEPSAVFSNGYEEGDFSGWTGETDTAGNFSVQDSVKHAGTYAAKFEVDATTEAYAYKNIGSDYAECYVSVWIYFNDVTAVDTANGILRCIRTQTAAGGSTMYVGVNTENSPYDINRLELVYETDGGTGYPAHQAIAPSAETWYKITMYWKSATAPGANDGVVKTWFGGTLKHNISGVDSDGIAGIGRVAIGNFIIQWSLDQGILIYFDDVVFDEGEPSDP